MVDIERKQLQHSRDQSLREKDIFIAECLEERKSLQEERLLLQAMHKDTTKKDEETRRISYVQRLPWNWGGICENYFQFY